jgi:hypothetical protein
MKLYIVSLDRYLATLEVFCFLSFVDQVPFKIHRAHPPQADSGFLQVVVIENASAMPFCSEPAVFRAEAFPMNANNFTSGMVMSQP